MGKARFDINPHVIRQLGSELVSDSVTAIMELIKNSYDADADYVKVTINTKDILNEPTLFYSGGTALPFQKAGFEPIRPEPEILRVPIE